MNTNEGAKRPQEEPETAETSLEEDLAIPPSSGVVEETRVVRRIVVPDVTDSQNLDDPRSPGIQDRTTTAPLPSLNPLSKTIKEPEVIRKLIVPTEADTSKDSNDPQSPDM